MPRLKQTVTTSLRDDLAASLREYREHVAPQFKRIGAKHWLDDIDRTIAALEGDEDVLLRDWQLMTALDGEEARAVNAIGGAFVVHADDTYEPHRQPGR
jgi:hypothetical protein